MSTGWIVFLSVTGVFLLAILYAAWRIRRYLAKSQDAIKDGFADVAEELDSYQTKTQ